jgi:hypothetical protein
MEVLSKHQCLFDDDGISAVLKDHYVCIPDFEEILEMLGLEMEEIKEIFDEPYKEE